MFLNNKYTNIYYHLIQNYSTTFGEKHHIIPKSLGGSDDVTNIVTVSPRVHFILHRLLCKIVKTKKHKNSMNYALFMMMNRQICNFTSRDYERVRNTISKQMKQNNPMFNPEISKLFKKKRPEQSEVAKRRNEKYWCDKARPLREFACPICNEPIITRIPSKTTCSKSCSAKLQHKK